MMLLLMMAAMMPMRAEIYSGDCGAQGDNVKWELNTETGELTISGNGEMKDYDYSEAPWCYVSAILSAQISNGVTSIGNRAFLDCTSLTSITIPEGVTSIGEDAFAYCANLASITLPESLKSIGSGAFTECMNLVAISIPKGMTKL